MKNFLTILTLLILLIPTALVAQEKPLDIMEIIEDTKQYKEYLEGLDIVPEIIGDTENEDTFVVVEYALHSDDESNTSIIFIIDKNDLSINEIYKAYTKYENTMYESISDNPQPRYNSGCNFFKCTETKTNYNYTPARGCTFALREPCNQVKVIPKYGYIISYACKGYLWISCNISTSKECISGITYNNVCIS